MNHEDYKVLAKVRFERAKELVHEAELLIEDNAYKSANNRAYYAIEKQSTVYLHYQMSQSKRTKDAFFSSTNYMLNPSLLLLIEKTLNPP